MCIRDSLSPWNPNDHINPATRCAVWRGGRGLCDVCAQAEGAAAVGVRGGADGDALFSEQCAGAVLATVSYTHLDVYKRQMQSLAAMRHFDFNAAGAYSYEQAVETIRQLELPMQDIEQQFKRAVLNVLLRNQDDHVKNCLLYTSRCV